MATSVHASVFLDHGMPQVMDCVTSVTYPVKVILGDVTVHLTEEQAVSLESQLVHVLGGLRADALAQS